jgi:hypothetical protein
MTTEIRRGIIKAFDGTSLCSVQLDGSLTTWLKNVTINLALEAGDVVVGRKCAVALFDPANQADAVILAVWA